MQLPHTKGCLVCGKDNPHGLHLSSHVDPVTGIVQTNFTPEPHHIGFENIIHGGVLATVLDELMVWCAIWASKRVCVAAEMSLRFVRKAGVGERLIAVASISRQRSRLIETTGELRLGTELVCTASGKYVPLGVGETAGFWKTFVEDSTTLQAVEMLKQFGGNTGV